MSNIIPSNELYEMYFQIALPMIKTLQSMMLRNIKESLQQLRARNFAIVTLTAIILRMEKPNFLEIVGSNQ